MVLQAASQYKVLKYDINKKTLKTSLILQLSPNSRLQHCHERVLNLSRPRANHGLPEEVELPPSPFTLFILPVLDNPSCLPKYD